MEGRVLAENTFNTSAKTIKLSANHPRQLVTTYTPLNVTLRKYSLGHGMYLGCTFR